MKGEKTSLSYSISLSMSSISIQSYGLLCQRQVFQELGGAGYQYAGAFSGIKLKKKKKTFVGSV